MYRILLLLFMTLLFQSCQVAEDVASSKQVAQNNFPGASIITVLPSNGWKKLGDDIDVSLVFALPMKVVGMPYISAQIGFNTRRFYYVSGSGSTNLIFRYSVSGSDLDTDGIAFIPTVNLNGGSITYIQNNQLVENISTSLTIPTSMIKVDGIPPYPMQVTAPAGGNYATGQRLQYFIDYSEKVFVSGLPNFDIYLNSGTVPANYKSGSGTAKLEFARTLLPADIDADGFFTGTTLNSFASITDEAGNTAPSYLYSTLSPNILLNVVLPNITSITPPANATYTLGQQLNFTVNFSQSVNVTGTPSININLSTGSVLATYVSGTGTSALIFRYTVLTNHVDSDGISLVSPIVLNGGTIKNLAGTQNAALLFSAPVTSGILIDAATGPYVVSTVLPPNGFYLEGQNINFKLKFNRLVNVTNFPRLPVIVGSTTTFADYTMGDGTDELTFTYTPTVAQEDLDGITLSGPIDLNGGMIADINLKQAILNYVPASTVGIKVDGTTPTVTNISWSGTGILQQGQHLNFSVQFSEVVNITGAPTLSIVVGTTSYNAVLISGNGTNTLNFRHIIQVGDIDTNGVEINSPLVLNLGTIKDPRGHDASLIFLDPIFTTGYTVDAEVPTVTTFTGPTDGTYKIGDNLDFVVNWSEPIYVSGTPTIALTVGATSLSASFINTSLTTSTTSVFRYTVQTNHLDTNGIATSGIVLNGGLIRDAVGNNASLAAAAPVLTSVLVDGVVPYVSSIIKPADGIYRAGQALNFNLTWNEDINVVGSPTIQLIIGTTNVSASFTSTGTNTATFSYNVLSGQLDTDGINQISAIFLGPGITIKDLAGNDSYLQVNPDNLTGVKVDAILPTILTLIAPADGTYKFNDNIDFKVFWSEPVTIDPSGSPRISLTIGATTPLYATYIPAESTPTLSVFRHTVTNTEVDTDGIAIVGTSIGLNLSTIRDIAGNDAVLTFTSPVLTGVLVDGVSATILSWTPPANGTYGIGDDLFITVHFSENVIVNTAGGTPYIRVYTNGYDTAVYDSGSGTQDLVFKYTVTAGQSTGTPGFYLFGAIQLNSGTIKDVATNDAYITFPPSPAWKVYSLVKVDGNAPIASSAISNNISYPSDPNYFKPGHTIEYDVTFNEAVTVNGSPRLVLDIGGVTKYADYFQASSTTTSKKFRFIVDSGDVLLDLDGIDVNPTIDMFAGATMQDSAGNDFVGMIPFSEKDYVYYSSTAARYHITGSDYTSSNCYTFFECATSVNDISGNNRHLTTSPIGPMITNTFGSNSTKSMKFNNSSFLNMTTIAAKYVIIVMKTVTSPSIIATPSDHTLINKKYLVSNPFHFNSDSYASGPHYHPTYSFTPVVKFTSTSSIKAISMAPTQKRKTNNGAFPASYNGLESTSNLWAANTSYIYAFEHSGTTNWAYSGSQIGGSEFDGEIAEIIFLSGTITEAKIDQMVDQLNTIHGIY
jgi:hypothetical protein